MQKLYKLALLSLTTALAFGCQTKAIDITNMPYTQEQLQEYRSQLSEEEREEFDQMSEEEQIRIMQEEIEKK